MAFSLSFAGVQVSLNPSSSSDGDGNANFCITGVRHCDDGHIEAEVCNFSGTIIISEESLMKCESSCSREVVVDAIPEALVDNPSPFLLAAGSNAGNETSSFTTAKRSAPPEPYVPPISHQTSQLTVEIDSEDDEEKKFQSPESNNGGGVRFDLFNTQIIQETKKVDLTLHKACENDETEIDDLREILRSKPELASVQDDFGDYPAHIFANNDAFIYTSSDYDVQQFVFELYTACPTAFLTEGYDGQIPFCGTIVDWIDGCHSLYAREGKEVHRVSEIKTLTKSTRVINSLCVREEVQKLTSLPTQVNLTPKVIYSFKMLSHVLDELSGAALEDISNRREFWAVASKRRDKIIGSIASLPFIVRTLLLIENKDERDALFNLSVCRNLLFRPESVDLWLVALLSGGERARDCATDYLCMISTSSLSGLFGRRMNWSKADGKRFHSMRENLYDEIGKLTSFLPCMLHLGDSLYQVAPRRAVKYVVESTIGRPIPVYLMFMEIFLLLILMTSYRIIVELVYLQDNFTSQYPEFLWLALTIAVYFACRDIATLISFSGTEENLAWKYASSFSNFIGYVTTASVITVLSMIHINGNVEGRNFVGIVAGLLWWKFLLTVKGMSENLSTLIYTIMQIAVALKYFLAIFLISIFFFADMIDIVKKTSGECDHFDGEMDSGLEAFCSLTPLQSYLSMYAIMIGGYEISSLEGSSALVSLLFVAASFSGVIVLVNILIAIVTGEYENARGRSCILFARARLEAAARQVAREKIMFPPDDPTSGIGRKFWRLSARVKYVGVIVLVEYFLIKSLLSCSHLHKDGMLGDFLYVAMISCAVLYHMFLVASQIFLGARCICRLESLRWLRGSKFHRLMLNISLKPVCRYLSSVGLGKGEKCPDASDIDLLNDHPLSHHEFVGQQADFENNIQEAIKASETRILHAVKSIMFSIPLE
ncbi:hypothetical protein ACHAXR_013255 [Thalassiosira sp. AJA248-18]